MSQSLPRLLALLALTAATAVAGLLVTGRVGGGAGNGNQLSSGQPAVQGFNKSPRSGKFTMNMRVQVSGKAAAQFGGAANIRMTGAFQSVDKGRTPAVAVDASATAGGQDIRFGVTVVQNRGFIKFGNSYYELPQQELQRVLNQRAARAKQQDVAALLGIDPRNWLEDTKDEGAATVDGVSTRHVSAKVNASRLTEDILTAARRADPSSAAGLSGDQLDQFRSAIKDASLDAYVGKSDDILRKLTLHARVASDDGSGDIDLDLLVTDVNAPQTISAPPSAKPFSALQGAMSSGGLGALAGATSVAGRSAPSQPPSSPAPAPSPGSGAVESGSAPTETQSYLACVRKAATPQELQRCQALLP
jgi:hypothetical protein